GGPAVSLTINAPASAPANTPFEITVTARDAHGNIAESYEGTVHFTSSDAQATLPSNAAFDNDDHGVKTFSVTLRGAGTHSITVTDVANATITGSANVAVQGGMLPPPASIDAVATSTTSASIVWSPVANASSYVVERSFNGGAFIPILTTSMTSHQDNGLASATSYLYRVHALDATNTPGANSAIDVASTIALTDDPSGRIRAADFHDLRTAIDALRRTAGLANATYTNAIVAGAPVRAVDLTEMRNALNGGRSAAGMSAYAFAESIVAGVTTIKHAHLDELRSALGTVGSN
ncbi:MAG TPA: fibronectin type III domain-containing protein, partial [Thermoanaerobaculia bacterium]|nr:fibronectin type III domain-containing protein [Thermoanaerobaculia bacterium]